MKQATTARLRAPAAIMPLIIRPMIVGPLIVGPLIVGLGSPAGAQTVPAVAPPAGAASPTTPPDTGVGLQDIVVTANKIGAQRLQHTPTSISVATGAQLENGGIQNVGDLAQFIPNTSFAQNLSHAEIYIRGIGSNNTGVGSDPDVTTQIDGVYVARSSGQLMSFADVDRVEVLRGPQGTLYGRNAVGGTINVVSRQPTDQLAGKAILSGGNYGYFQSQGYISGPLANNLQASIAGDFQRHDPYFKNIAPGGQDIGGNENGAIKAQLRWEPAPNIDATTRADYSFNHGPFEIYSQLLAPTAFPSLANSIIGQFDKVSLNSPQYLSSHDWGVSEDINWHIGDHVTIKSLTAYRVDLFNFSVDSDGTEQNLTYFTSAERDQAISQEFNVQYNSTKLNAVGGIYFFHDRDIGVNLISVYPSIVTPAARALNNGGTSLVYSTSGAVFGQATYSFTPKFSVILGARYTIEHKDLDQLYQRTSLNPAILGVSFPGFPTSFSASKGYNAFTPKFGLNWQVTPDALLYASITRGFKSGGFNYAATSASIASFEPETIWSYEAGLKSEWFDRRLRFNLDGFYYNYKNLQVQQMLAPGVTTIGNAATATGRGIEAELVAKPTNSLQFTGNFSILNAHYGQYPSSSIATGLIAFVPNEVCVIGATGPSCTVNASGNRLNNSPMYSALAAIDYHWTVGPAATISAHADYTWHTRSYFDPSNALILSQHAYGLINAQLALEYRDWRFELFGKNIGNVHYAVSESGAGSVPAAFVGDPRTFGIRASFKW